MTGTWAGAAWRTAAAPPAAHSRPRRRRSGSRAFVGPESLALVGQRLRAAFPFGMMWLQGRAPARPAPGASTCGLRTRTDRPPGPGIGLRPQVQGQAQARPSQGSRLLAASSERQLLCGAQAPGAPGGRVGGRGPVFRFQRRRVANKFTQFPGGNQAPAAWPPGLGRPGPRELQPVYRGSNQPCQATLTASIKVSHTWPRAQWLEHPLVR